MLGPATIIRQERLKKTGPRTSPLGLFTINEEDEQQRNGNSRRLKATVHDLPCRTRGRDFEHRRKEEGHRNKPYERRAVSLGRLSSAALGQINNNAITKSELHPILKVDDRQRLARERRVEHEKQIAARESYWVEKEEKARQHYEKHLEERKKKLEEQRIKEERRRAAVDEKRKQRLEEEKEHHEAVVRRTLERSQKPRPKPNRWSWGGTLQSNPNISNSDPERRSISTVNLSKHVDPVISKRLSASSATLMNAPDRARRLQLTPWESSVVSRLLTPTHSFLARSKSTATLSGDSASCSPISPQPYKTAGSRSGERPRLFVSTFETAGRRRTTHSPRRDKRDKDGHSEIAPALLNLSSSVKRSPSPSMHKARPPAVALVWHSEKTSAPILLKTTESATSTSRNSPISQRPPSPGNVRPIKKQILLNINEMNTDNEFGLENDEEQELKVALPFSGDCSTEQSLFEKSEPPKENAPALPSPLPSPSLPVPISSKISAGTNNPEEATRILTEKRRLAREQREREEQETREREEEERRKREEMAQRVAEERARRDEEARKQEAERRQQEEMERKEKEQQLLKLAEEKKQKEKEELSRLQKQKEEEARQREEAEQNRLEREKHFQREEQARLERKKRLEEIMKRTRGEATDKQSSSQQNGGISRPAHETANQPVESEQVSPNQFSKESPSIGELGSLSHISSQLIGLVDSHNTENQPNENGLPMQNEDFEEHIDLPAGTKLSKVDSFNNDGSNITDIPFNPILAFQETEILSPMAQIDSVQTQQTAEVI